MHPSPPLRSFRGTAKAQGCRGRRETEVRDVADSAGTRDWLSGAQPAEPGLVCHVMRGRHGVM